VLFRNDTTGGALQFTEVAENTGVAFAGWAWGCTFFDADNDGLLDLAVTNGWSVRFDFDPSVFFLNLGGNPVTFSDLSDTVGFNDTLRGVSLIAADYDRDGHLDLVQTTRTLREQTSQLRLLKNDPDPQADSNNYLVIKPRMEGPNHWAIGAVVQARAGEITMMRLITAGTSFMGQEPAEAHFGLGPVEQVDEVIIHWPDGTRSVVTNISANQVLKVDNSSASAGEGEGEELSGEEIEQEREGEEEGEAVVNEGEDEGEEAGDEVVDDAEGEGDPRPTACPASVLAKGTSFAGRLDNIRALRDTYAIRNFPAWKLTRSFYCAGPSNGGVGP